MKEKLYYVNIYHIRAQICVLLCLYYTERKYLIHTKSSAPLPRLLLCKYNFTDFQTVSSTTAIGPYK